MMRREPEIKHSHMQEQIIMRNTLRKTMRDMRESKMKNTRSSFCIRKRILLERRK